MSANSLPPSPTASPIPPPSTINGNTHYSLPPHHPKQHSTYLTTTHEIFLKCPVLTLMQDSLYYRGHCQGLCGVISRLSCQGEQPLNLFTSREGWFYHFRKQASLHNIQTTGEPASANHPPAIPFKSTVLLFWRGGAVSCMLNHRYCKLRKWESLNTQIR